jgi:hypothetical protein
VPQLFPDPGAVEDFPVFVKPDRGQGSQGARVVWSRDELRRSLADVPGAIVSEYLPGEEYTVDCFSDREEGLLFAGARIRRRVRNGIAVNTRTVDLPEAPGLARIIGERLALHGAWFFQLRRASDGTLALLEVGPRIAGSMAAHRVQGVNFPLLCVYEHERVPIRIQTNPGAVELDRALGNRYRHAIDFSVLYVDLDDTLVLGGRVNEEVIRLVYQCINQGKKVVLITRRTRALEETLAEHRIAGLFDEIVRVPEGEKKSRYVKDQDSIFVDDSFSERLDVSTERHVPTFDSSMIELITSGKHG